MYNIICMEMIHMHHVLCYFVHKIWFEEFVYEICIPYLIVWFGLLRIYVALAVFQPYRDLEAGDNQSLKIQVARRGIEPRTSCSASQELNHSATAAPYLI